MSAPHDDKPSHAKQRLDQWLLQRGLAPTRSKARDLIKEGFVKVDGETITKPGSLWVPGVVITVAEDAPDHVARSAAKLERALELFTLDVKGRTALDIGASTGGFTEVLLERGAAHVIAVDVGHDQLHQRLACDARVTSLEGRDARSLTADDMPELPSIITADLSFISLIKAIEPALSLMQPGSWGVMLIKPQFELTRKELNKKGVVKEEAKRQQAIQTVINWFAAQPTWHVLGHAPSPIKGHAGNKEELLCIGKEDEV